MDLDKALQFVETYARGYVSYLLAFFSEPSPEKTEAQTVDPFKTIVLYAILSAFLGAVFSTRAVSGLFPHQSDLMVHMSQEFAYWIALAFALYLVLRVSGAPKVGLDALLTVLTVTPVAYAVAGYGSYLVSIVGLAFVRCATDVRGPAFIAAVVIQLGLTVAYFPRYLARVPGLSRPQVVGGSAALILLIVLVQVLYIAEVVKQRDDAREAAAKAAASAPGTSKPQANGGSQECVRSP